MMIPSFDKVGTILIDCVKKENTEKPQMMRIKSVKMVNFTKPREESSPAASELAADLNPVPLNPRVPMGSGYKGKC